MARQEINIGTGINAGDGEAIRNAFSKINSMMAELYAILTANGIEPSLLQSGIPVSKLETIATGNVLANLTGSPAAPAATTLAALAAALPVSTVAALSSAYTVVAADAGKTFSASGTWTLSLTAAATLGNGFAFRIKNTGTGVITVDPNGAETIDGKTTITIPSLAEALIVGDGSGWRTFGMTPQVLLASGAVSAAATLDLALPAGYSAYRCVLRDIEPVTGNTALQMRVATDGVPTFLSTTIYRNAGLGLDQAASGANIGNGASNTNALSLNSAQIAGANFASLFDILINPGSPNQPSVTYLASFTRHSTSYVAVQAGAGAIQTGTRLSHVRFLYTSGNILASSYELYGLRN